MIQFKSPSPLSIGVFRRFQTTMTIETGTGRVLFAVIFIVLFDALMIIDYAVICTEKESKKEHTHSDSQETPRSRIESGKKKEERTRNLAYTLTRIHTHTIANERQCDGHCSIRAQRQRIK